MKDKDLYDDIYEGVVAARDIVDPCGKPHIKLQPRDEVLRVFERRLVKLKPKFLKILHARKVQTEKTKLPAALLLSWYASVLI